MEAFKEFSEMIAFPKGQLRLTTVREAFIGLNDTSEIPRCHLTLADMFRVRSGAASKKHFSRKRLNYEAQSCGLECQISDFWHPKEHRFLSVHEFARLQSFPDSYQFRTKKKGRLMGNAVPPLAMWWIALNGTPPPIDPARPYVEWLNALWKAHQMTKAKDARTVVSLFAGCGGSSLGYSAAGYRELLAVEYDPLAIESFRANFPDVLVYDDDIKKLSGKEALRLSKVKEGELDLLDASPPCQGFSMAGKRLHYDPRNELAFEYIRLLRAYRPRWTLMENVPGLARGKMRLILRDILKEVRIAGYDAEARLVDFSKLGVPQKRIRLILIGKRKDVRMQSVRSNKDVRRLISIGEACEHVKDTSSPRLDTTRRYSDIYTLIHPGRNADSVLNKGWSNTVRPNSIHPSPTLPALQTGTGRGFASIVHWAEARKLSIGEAKRIQSFPDQYQIHGEDYEVKWKQIGNAVPPLAAYAFGRTTE